MKFYLQLTSLVFLFVAEAQNLEKNLETFHSSAKEIAGHTEMKLYLTSNAVLVLDDLITLLPFPPKGKKVGYITTASHNASWAFNNIKKIEQAGFNVKPIDLATLSANDLEVTFEDSDIIWVGGGNTFYLLQEVRRSGFDKFLVKKIAEGVPYIGTSAGSILLGPNIELVKFADDPLEAPHLTSYEGLNIFPMVPLAHIDNPEFKVFYQDILNFALEHNIPFVSLQEKQFIYVEGTKWRIFNAKE